MGQGPWGVMDGPYSQGYDYDAWGNLTHRYGWGGEVQGGGAGQSSDRFYTYSNNRRTDSGFTYDASGNLTFDGGQHFTYDAAGRQTSSHWTQLQQGYDGDGLRVRKSDDSTAGVYYLRSSVLGGQVVAEISSTGGWQRGYVFAGTGLLAVQQGGVFFVHEDPVTKSKRVTDMSGSVVSAVELDPFGADTSRSGNAAFQPKKFTSYERDYNGSDEALFRRYNRWHSRFDQPDPYGGSYDLTDPQSLNRYAYTQNDPVNFVDPTGLERNICFNIHMGDGQYYPLCVETDPWGGYYPQDPRGPWVDPEEFEEEFGPPPPSPWNCGVNPVTNSPRINPASSGRLGELRPGVGGHGGFRRRTGGRHEGIDIAAPVGTPIHANRDGVVVGIRRGYAGGYGNSVIIMHAENAYTFYAHLRDAPSLNEGDTVSGGQIIGYAGRTGNVPPRQPASEDHLHFAFKSSPILLRRGERFDDPVAYLNGPCP